MLKDNIEASSCSKLQEIDNHQGEVFKILSNGHASDVEVYYREIVPDSVCVHYASNECKFGDHCHKGHSFLKSCSIGCYIEASFSTRKVWSTAIKELWNIDRYKCGFDSFLITSFEPGY
jgi:hypothetical protein